MKTKLPMNIMKLIAVASAAAFIAVTASAKPADDGRKKADIIKENRSLRSEIDSLKAELERYREELRRTDSISNEILEIYETKKPRSKNQSPCGKWRRPRATFLAGNSCSRC